MEYYSFNRPRRDGWLSWPCWLTDSGRFTHKVVTRPAVSLAQDRESSPARTGVLTTMLRNQLNHDYHCFLHHIYTILRLILYHYRHLFVNVYYKSSQVK